MNLTETEKTLQRVLHDSPYRLVCDDGDRVDPVRLFRGGSASIADIEGGWCVDRSLEVDGASMNLERFAEMLLKDSEKVFKLRAETGEGKTTFLRQLAFYFRRTNAAIVVEWLDLRRHKPSCVSDVAAMTKRPVVVVTELTPSIPEDAVHEAAETALGRGDPLRSPILVAGRPRQIGEWACPGVSVRFGALTDQGWVDLAQRLADARAFALEKGLIISKALPGVDRFLATRDIRLFADRFLAVALLRATFGADFKSKLQTEYRSLAKPGQEVYRYICYFHAVGVPLPVPLLIRLLNLSYVDFAEILKKYPAGDPFEICEPQLESTDEYQYDSFAVSRSPIVAQVVLQEEELLRERLVDFLGRLFDVARDLKENGQPTPNDVGLVRSVLEGYGSWAPIVDPGGEGGKKRGRIRTVIRRTLEQKRDWLDAARKTVSSSKQWPQAASWARLMYHLLPTPLQPGVPSTSFLMDENAEWLKVIRALAPADVQATVNYLSGKQRLLSAEAEATLSKDLAKDVVAEWKGLIGATRLGPDFYVDLAHYAKKSELYELAAQAFEHALVLAGSPELQMEYSIFLRKLKGDLSKGAFRMVLDEAWNTSSKLRRPNAMTGTWLAQELLSSERARAIQVLKAVLEKVCWGEAFLELAAHASRDTALQNWLSDYFRAHEPDKAWSTPLGAALAWHGAAMLARYRSDEEGEAQCLEKACSAYLEADDTQGEKMWPVPGDKWGRAAARLQELGSADSAVRLAEFQRAKALYDKRSRKRARW
jgi:hypothetical protein